MFVGWLKTGFSTFHLSSTRTNQRTCCKPAASISTCRDWCSRCATRFSTKNRKHVESMSQTHTNLFDQVCSQVFRKPGCKPGRKQLARIMECGLTTTLTYDWVCIRLCVCDSPSALLLNGYLRNSNGAPEQAFLWSQQLGEKIKFCELLRRKLSIQCCWSNSTPPTHL